MGYVATATVFALVTSYMWLQLAALRFWKGAFSAFSVLILLGWTVKVTILLHEFRQAPSMHDYWQYEIAYCTLIAAICLFIISWFRSVVADVARIRTKALRTQSYRQ